MLTTNRLLLRQLDLPDAAFIIALLNTPGWLQYIGDRKVKTIEAAEQYLSNGPMKSYRENGFGLLLVVDRKNGSALGMCGLIRRPNLDHPDLGFAMLPEHSGKGYAFEAATAVLDHAKTKLNIHTVAAITVPENDASIKLLQRLGFVFEKDILWEDGGEILRLFLRNS